MSKQSLSLLQLNWYCVPNLLSNIVILSFHRLGQVTAAGLAGVQQTAYPGHTSALPATRLATVDCTTCEELIQLLGLRNNYQSLILKHLES